MKNLYQLKISGIYKFKTKDMTYILRVWGGEQDTMDTYSLSLMDSQEHLKKIIGSVNVKNSSLNKLSKGETIMSITSKNKIKGKLTRMKDLY